MPEYRAAIPAMPATNVADSAHFYAKHFGFEIAYLGDGFAVLQRDDVKLNLWQADDESWQQSDGTRPVVSGAESFIAGTASCRIEVTEIEALYQDCENAGIVHPNGPLTDQDFGQRDFATLDPDGNLIAFFSYMDRPADR